MRFTVGQTYAFLTVDFEAAHLRMTPLFIPWEDKLKAIKVHVLTCKEHHKVSAEYDGDHERKCDGFVFHDDKGAVWHNQYPVAIYGQLDDSMDYMVHRHYETAELMQVDDEGEPLVDGDGRYIKRTDPEAQAKWADFEYDMDYPARLATKHIAEIYRCLHPKKPQALSDTQKKALQEHLDALIAAVETATAQKLFFEPLVFRYLDDRPMKASSFIIARLSGDEEVTQIAEKHVPAGALLSKEDFEKQIPIGGMIYRVVREQDTWKFHEAQRVATGPLDEDTDAIFFHIKYAGRHRDSLSYLDCNISRLNNYNFNFAFADKRLAQAYFDFANDPKNAALFQKSVLTAYRKV